MSVKRVVFLSFVFSTMFIIPFEHAFAAEGNNKDCPKVSSSIAAYLASLDVSARTDTYTGRNRGSRPLIFDSSVWTASPSVALGRALDDEIIAAAGEEETPSTDDLLNEALRLLRGGFITVAEYRELVRHILLPYFFETVARWRAVGAFLQQVEQRMLARSTSTLRRKCFAPVHTLAQAVRSMVHDFGAMGTAPSFEQVVSVYQTQGYDIAEVEAAVF